MSFSSVPEEEEEVSPIESVKDCLYEIWNGATGCDLARLENALKSEFASEVDFNAVPEGMEDSAEPALISVCDMPDDENCIQIIKILLEKGSDPNNSSTLYDDDGMTALISIAGSDSDVTEHVQALIDGGAKVTPRAIMAAFGRGKDAQGDILGLLLSKVEEGSAADAIKNAKDADGSTPLHVARTVANMKLALESGCDIAARKSDDEEMTCLHTAAFRSTEESSLLVPFLLQQPGADEILNAKTKQFGSTPLHNACYCLAADAIKALVAAGADKSIKDEDGLTPAEALQERKKMLEEELLAEEKEGDEENYDDELIADMMKDLANIEDCFGYLT